MDSVEIKRLKLILLVSSLACLVFLFLSAYEEHFAGTWRGHQSAYRRLAIQRAGSESVRAAAESMRVELRQVFLPDLDRIDRCTTCHVGIDDPRMVDADLPLRTHSGSVFEHHPLEKFGCTVCHDGQGRAVNQANAHGEVAHWTHPLLTGERVYTNCPRCHYETDLFGAEEDLYTRGRAPRPLRQSELASAVPGSSGPHSDSIARGKELLLETGCLGCHKYRGRGGILGPDISYVGDKTVHDFDFTHIVGEHTLDQWLREHFAHPADVSPGSVMPDFGFDDAQIADLTLYLLSTHEKSMPAAYTPVPPRDRGAPATGGQLYAMFCSGCHGSDGQGSTVREQRNAVLAVDAPPELMVPSLNHPDTLAVASDAYLRSIVAFGRENTNMLGWGLTADGGLRDEEIDGIVDYIRSWTRPGPDLGAVSASRGNSRHGRAIFQQNCAACHGQRGEGGIGVSLNSPTFLGVASDRFLATTIAEGRPDTAMPGWRQFDTQQVSDLLAYLRTWQPRQNDLQTVLGLTSSTPDERRAARVSADVGETLYKANCVTCHGPDGEGDLGPSLSTQEFLTVISDEYLYETLASGRPGTGMPAWRHLSSEDVASLILFIRTWQSHTARTLPTTPVVGDWDTGRFLFEGTCAGCHGNDAEGGVGPQLSNPVFLRTASDAMLRRWIAYGKTGTPMRAFLKGGQGTVELLPRQIDDLVAYLRSLERDRRVSIAKRPSGRPELGRLWYAVSCASCHGERGEGASGPALANRRFLGAASDGFLMATMAMGRDGTEMRPVKKSAQSILSLTSDQVNDVVAYLRSWEYNPPQQGVVHRYVVPWDLARGRILYESHCAGCHGIDGKGEIEEPGQLSAWAPNLNNKGFLAAATDGFLQATIVRGRSGTAMRPFGHGAQGLVDLTSDDIDDLVAYIRRWSAEPGLPITIPAEIETTTDSTTEVPKQHETARRHETSAGDVHAPPRSSNAVGVALNLKEGD